MNDTAIRVRVEFVRQWPLCQSAMQDIIGHLHALGADQYAIDSALRIDFPGLPENAYGNTIAIELMHLLKTPARRQVLEPEELAAQEPATESPEQRRREALALIGILMARDCMVIRLGERVKVEYRGEGVPERLPADLKARLAKYADELWDIAEAPTKVVI